MGYIDESGAGAHPTAVGATAIPGTFWVHVDEVSMPVPHAAGTAGSLQKWRAFGLARKNHQYHNKVRE